jgi:hypothetical protein
LPENLHIYMLENGDDESPFLLENGKTRRIDI